MTERRRLSTLRPPRETDGAGFSSPFQSTGNAIAIPDDFVRLEIAAMTEPCGETFGSAGALTGLLTPCGSVTTD